MRYSNKNERSQFLASRSSVLMVHPNVGDLGLRPHVCTSRGCQPLYVPDVACNVSTVMTDKLLPERPYRYEPRLKKQRPKPYGWMQQPRDVPKRKLAA